MHIPVREEWLASRREAIIDPDLPIIDPHHHLWDRPEGTYLYPELKADLEDGHRILGTVYVQCRSMYRTEGPDILRPLGEIEFVKAVAQKAEAQGSGACIGMVGYVDLTLGEAAAPAIETAVEVGRGLLKGIRVPVAWHESPDVVSSPVRPPQGLMASDAFRDGVRRLAAHELSLDVWAYHTQLGEVIDLARAIPEVSVIVDHCGGPIGCGPYAGRRPEVFQHWSGFVRELARLPNVTMKIGGLAMRVGGFDFHERPLPPSSEELATAWQPYVDTLIAAFGPQRCMFESNFPVDKGMGSYRTFWNACKRMSADLSPSDRSALFSDTARRIYRLG